MRNILLKYVLWHTEYQLKYEELVKAKDKSILERNWWKVVVAKIATTTSHGAISGKTQDNETMIYNLDAIISVGYRVNPIKSTIFRIWANTVLMGYRITHFDKRIY